jgi:hypothetical protein
MAAPMDGAPDFMILTALWVRAWLVIEHWRIAHGFEYLAQQVGIILVDVHQAIPSLDQLFEGTACMRRLTATAAMLLNI